MSIPSHWGSQPPLRADVGDLWLDTTMPFRSTLKVRTNTEWVTIAELQTGSEPHDALFSRFMRDTDA